MFCETVEDGTRREDGVLCPVDSGTPRAHHAVSWPCGNIVVRCHFRQRVEVLWTWDTSCLIRSDFLERLVSEGFTGFVTRQALVEFPNATVCRDYRELLVTGWGGVARRESGIRLKSECPYCGSRTYTPCENPDDVLDEAQWDGSDLFRIWPMPHYFASSRLEAFLCKSHFRYGLLLTLGQLHTPQFKRLSLGYGPLPLDTRMPRARALGIAPELTSRVYWPAWDNVDELYILKA